MNFYNIKKIIIFFFLLLFSHSSLVFATPSQKASSKIIYRYYDKNGIANISTNITANHIHHGYEILNQNMQVIQKYPAYNLERNLQYEKNYQNSIEKNKNDARLKQAYITSQNAIQKKETALTTLEKQVIFQQKQLNILQDERKNLLNEEMKLIRTDQKILNNIKIQLQQNSYNIAQIKQNMIHLKDTYHSTNLKYNQLIFRLQQNE